MWRAAQAAERLQWESRRDSAADGCAKDHAVEGQYRLRHSLTSSRLSDSGAYWTLPGTTCCRRVALPSMTTRRTAQQHRPDSAVFGAGARTRTGIGCLQDRRGSSTECWRVLFLQLRSGGSSSESAPVGRVAAGGMTVRLPVVGDDPGRER